MSEGRVKEFDTTQKLLNDQTSYFYGLWKEA